MPDRWGHDHRVALASAVIIPMCCRKSQFCGRRNQAFAHWYVWSILLPALILTPALLHSAQLAEVSPADAPLRGRRGSRRTHGHSPLPSLPRPAARLQGTGMRSIRARSRPRDRPRHLQRLTAHLQGTLQGWRKARRGSWRRPRRSCRRNRNTRPPPRRRRDPRARRPPVGSNRSSLLRTRCSRSGNCESKRHHRDADRLAR